MEAILNSLKTKQHRASMSANYYAIWKKFNTFLITLDARPPDWEQRLALYCAYLVEIDKLQSSTIKSYISAIKAVLKSDGYNWNDSKSLFKCNSQGM